MSSIAFDFDGVLNNLPVVWTQYLNDTFNRNVDGDNLKYYDMTRNFNDLSYSSIMLPLLFSDMWEKVSAKDGAKELIDKLVATGNTVYIITATGPEGWSVKYNSCVRRLFPDFPVDNIILTSRKDLIKVDYLIDDYSENLRDFEGVRILWDASYNKYANTNHYDYRASTFEEVYGIISKNNHTTDSKKTLCE